MVMQRTQDPPVQVSSEFAAAIPPAPQTSTQVAQLSAVAANIDQRSQLVCKDLLVGDTRARAEKEAHEALDQMLGNRQVATVFGTDALEGVNQLNDKMLKDHPQVEIPELEDLLKGLVREMRSKGKKYDPKDEDVLKKYKAAKGRVLGIFHFGKSFFQLFMDDIRDLDAQFDYIAQKLQGRQYQLLKNVGYYDTYYELNEQEISNLIYKIGVMEMIRDLAKEKAQGVQVGNANLGDRGGEQQAEILELVNLLENKIIAFKGRLFIAWAMAPQIRNMRSISVGLSARIDQTVEITIPTMKNTIAVWLTLNEAEQAKLVNQAVEDAYNASVNMFASATQAVVPEIVDSLATPALSPASVTAMTESLAKQADAIVEAFKNGKERRAALEKAMIDGKTVIDASTQKVNQAQLEQAIAAAKEAPIEIATSVPAATAS